MNRTEFLIELQEAMQKDDVIEVDTKFEDIPEWDSLALLTVSALINSEFNVVLSLEEVKNFVVVEDLLKRLGI